MKPTALSIPIAVTLMVTAFHSGVASAPRKTETPATVQPLAQLIETMGRVEIKRERQSNYQSARVGENLFVGDLIRVTNGSKGVVRCTSSSKTWTIPDDNLPRGVANVCSPPP